MKMTHEQMETFCKAAATGLALGLQHRYEWYVNAQRMLSHVFYAEIPVRADKLNQAFIAFEKETASCSEEEELLRTMDLAGYVELVNEYYNKAKPHD